MNNFKEFVDVLKACPLTLKDRELVVELNEAEVSEATFENVVKDTGYSFDDVRTIRKGNGHLSTEATSWPEDCPLYKSWKSLFSFVGSTSKLPDNFFVVKQKLSSLDDTKEALSLELFCQVRYLLAAIADQCDPPNDGPSKGVRKLFFIIETENGVAKYSFKPTISWDALKNIPIDQEQIKLTKKLQQLVNLGDSQDTERRSVMRSAFHEVISVYHSDSTIFEGVLASIEKLYKRYEEHHDLFVRRFSINKILHEISEKDLAYTSKVNEILSSAQSKTLTIPGALILIGAVMKIEQLADGLAVALAILLTTILVHKALNVHRDTFDHISNQIRKEFKQYDVLSEKIEVRQKARETESELSSLLVKAEKNSGFMKFSIWLLCITALAFIAFTIINAESKSSPTEPNHEELQDSDISATRKENTAKLNDAEK